LDTDALRSERKTDADEAKRTDVHPQVIVVV
jgi:hypothetical protein